MCLLDFFLLSHMSISNILSAKQVLENLKFCANETFESRLSPTQGALSPNAISVKSFASHKSDDFTFISKVS